MSEENKTNKSQGALREEAVLSFWKENKIFEKSLEKEAPKGKYVFFEGRSYGANEWPERFSHALFSLQAKLTVTSASQPAQLHFSG